MNVWLPKPVYKAIPLVSILAGCLVVTTTPFQFSVIAKWTAVVFLIVYGLAIICARLYWAGEYSRLCVFPKKKGKKK